MLLRLHVMLTRNITKRSGIQGCKERECRFQTCDEHFQLHNLLLLYLYMNNLFWSSFYDKLLKANICSWLSLALCLLLIHLVDRSVSGPSTSSLKAVVALCVLCYLIMLSASKTLFPVSRLFCEDSLSFNKFIFLN